MTVERVRGNSEDGDRNYDNFPVGMRVLAVDDDPMCLKLLDGLLRKCQYHVTTTSQAKVALKMLRENRDRFDLVISDVHMPDMDGFKLLELVGLEMDLPVIMLSANSDPKLVMKGVTHGACDYLVKPIRIEELRNIWQHVIRRKKFDAKKQGKSTHDDKAHQGNGDVPQNMGNADQNGKLNKRRKDEEDESEDNEHDHEDPGTQKKPRVVWSIELHRKFVAAVNQLGIEKAVPKRILDLMNVEGLTRENVASHLQKYRLYLKRISSVATQQANMVAALGGNDAAYRRITGIDGFGDFRTLTGSGRLSNPAFSPYTQGGMLGRLNSPAGINLRSLPSPTVMHPSHAQTLSSSTGTLGKLHPGVSQANQTASVYQGVPSSLELDQLQQNTSAARVVDFNTVDESRIFSAPAAFADARALAINSNSNLTGVPNNPMMLLGNAQQILSGGGIVDQSSFPSESFNRDVVSSKFVDHGRNNENWQNADQLSKFPPNALVSNSSFSQGQLAFSNGRDNSSSAARLGFSSAATTSAPLEDSKGELHCQEGLLGGSIQNLSQASSQRWGAPKQSYSHNSNNMFSPLNPQASSNGVISPLSQTSGQSGITDRRMDMCLTGQSGVATSSFLQHGEVENPTMGSRTRSSEDYMLEQVRPQGAFVPNSYDSLDDLMSAMKREQNGSMFDGDLGFDAYQFG